MLNECPWLTCGSTSLLRGWRISCQKSGFACDTLLSKQSMFSVWIICLFLLESRTEENFMRNVAELTLLLLKKGKHQNRLYVLEMCDLCWCSNGDLEFCRNTLFETFLSHLCLETCGWELPFGLTILMEMCWVLGSVWSPVVTFSAVEVKFPEFPVTRSTAIYNAPQGKRPSPLTPQNCLFVH